MEAGVLQPKRHFTFQEYLQLEQQDGVRYEYYDGEVSAMADVSMNLCDIAFNINRSLNDALREKGGNSFQLSIKVSLNQDHFYLYPDVVLTCNEEDIKDGYIIRNPLLMVEVLSPSTETHDRNTKWNLYRRIPSLKYFLFVSQEQPFVELYSRSQPTTLYTYQAFDDIEEFIHFPEMEFTLGLRQIYRYVRFKSNPSQLFIS